MSVLFKAGTHIPPVVANILGVTVKVKPAEFFPETFTVKQDTCGCDTAEIMTGFASKEAAESFIDRLKRYLDTWVNPATKLVMPATFSIDEYDAYETEPEQIIDYVPGMGPRATVVVDYTMNDYCSALDQLARNRTYVYGTDYNVISSHIQSSEGSGDPAIKSFALVLWERYKEEQNSPKVTRATLGFSDEFFKEMGWVRASV